MQQGVPVMAGNFNDFFQYVTLTGFGVAGDPNYEAMKFYLQQAYSAPALQTDLDIWWDGSGLLSVQHSH
jgi:hypothetical protein